MRAGTIPSLVWDLGTIPCDPFGKFFLWPQLLSSHACPDLFSVECSWVSLHIALRFLSVQLSHFQYSVLPRIPALESLLYLFSSGSSLDLGEVTSFLCHHLEAFSIQGAIAMIGLTYFPHSLREDWPLSTTLKTIISCILSFLGERGFQERNQSGPCYSFLTRGKTPFWIILNLKNQNILLRNTLVYTCKR